MFRKTVLSLMFFAVLTTACASNRVAAMDRNIEKDVRSSIASAMTGHMYAVDVVAHSGVVTLTGSARSEEDRRAVAEAANRVKNVTSVINNLIVSPGQ